MSAILTSVAYGALGVTTFVSFIIAIICWCDRTTIHKVGRIFLFFFEVYLMLVKRQDGSFRKEFGLWICIEKNFFKTTFSEIEISIFSENHPPFHENGGVSKFGAPKNTLGVHNYKKKLFLFLFFPTFSSFLRCFFCAVASS